MLHHASPTGEEKAGAPDVPQQGHSSAAVPDRNGDAGAVDQPDGPANLERAKRQYATAHGVDVGSVTESVLASSAEGVEGWACKGLNVDARGPVGNAMYRAFKRAPAMANTYKWLTDDIKKKFRQCWCVHRSFDFVTTKRIHSVSTATRHDEVGSWKSELQLQMHFGGVGVAEATRQATSYISNCRKYEDSYFPNYLVLTCSNKSVSKCPASQFEVGLAQDTFVKWNKWTEAHNYLLVEKLVTKSEEESWRELAEMIDQNATFETESKRCQAMRKYAAYHQVPVESVSPEDVSGSPGGIRGWCELQIAVPGITDKDKKKIEGDAATEEQVPQPAAKAKANPRNKRGSNGDGDGQAREKKPKKEQTALQQSEAKSKEILAQLARSQAVMNKISAHGDEIPTEWKWALPFLQDYNALLDKFQFGLKEQEDGQGQDLTDFVDDLKLSSLDRKSMTAFKRSYKDDYATLLALFVDRCSSLSAQILWFVSVPIGERG